MWHVTIDMWHVTIDMWHVTIDMLNVTFHMRHVTFDMSHVTCHLATFFSCVSSKVTFCHAVTCHMSYVICQMLMLILGTCWTTFVFMSILKSDYFSCCNMSHFTCHMSHVTCLCWSLGHAEQLLFSWVSSKVIVCHAVACHMSYVICQMLMLILGTCWTTFAFMSMLKSYWL